MYHVVYSWLVYFDDDVDKTNENDLYIETLANKIHILRFVFDYHKLMAWSIRQFDTAATLCSQFSLIFLKDNFVDGYKEWAVERGKKPNENKEWEARKINLHVCVFNTSERNFICFYWLLFEPSTILPYCSLSPLHFFFFFHFSIRTVCFCYFPSFFLVGCGHSAYVNLNALT